MNKAPSKLFVTTINWIYAVICEMKSRWSEDPLERARKKHIQKAVRERMKIGRKWVD